MWCHAPLVLVVSYNGDDVGGPARGSTLVIVLVFVLVLLDVITTTIGAG